MKLSVAIAHMPLPLLLSVSLSLKSHASWSPAPGAVPGHLLIGVRCRVWSQRFTLGLQLITAGRV